MRSTRPRPVTQVREMASRTWRPRWPTSPVRTGAAWSLRRRMKSAARPSVSTSSCQSGLLTRCGPSGPRQPPKPLRLPSGQRRRRQPLRRRRPRSAALWRMTRRLPSGTRRSCSAAFPATTTTRCWAGSCARTGSSTPSPTSPRTSAACAAWATPSWSASRTRAPSRRRRRSMASAVGRSRGARRSAASAGVRPSFRVWRPTLSATGTAP
mmetsp:Transcript_94599/g.282535  ORF Transcript_94599/g.282535 Transcript_94599/m.282535 type:complete len:210 (-) Transcript_94599:157-786(-)